MIQKLSLVILLFGIVGLPVNSLENLILVSLAITFILSFEVSLQHWKKSLSLVLILGIARFFLPSMEIQEGHNVFIVTGDNQVLEKELPPQVFSYLKTDFDTHYPVQKKCDSKEFGCWLAFPPPSKTFSFSSDGILQNPKYSRVVKSINFNGLSSLRIGTVNDVQYNYYKFKSDVSRETIPYFVMYEFPGKTLGASLCWKGKTLWQTSDNNFTPKIHNDFVCEPLDTHKVFGVGIDPNNPLIMKLDPSTLLKLSSILGLIFTTISVVGLLGLLLKIDDLKKLTFPIASVFFTFLTIYLMRQNLLTGYSPYPGGGDGLTHEGFARIIIQLFLDGQYLEVLRGQESIFYFMPGLRYFKAIEKVIFGDTNYGYVLFGVFVPLIFLRFFRAILCEKTSQILFFIFMLLPVFACFGLSNHLYINEINKGHAETLGYGLFLMAATIGLGDRDQIRLRQIIGMNLLFSLSIIARPNLIIPAAVFCLFISYWMLKKEGYTTTFLLFTGLLPVLLLPLHNWYFGHKLVLLTSASSIPENLLTPPLTYLKATFELMRGSFSSQSIESVVKHLKAWNDWKYFFRLLPLASVLYSLFSSKVSDKSRVLAFTALSMQVVLMFYVPDGRYNYLAWAFTFIVFMMQAERRFVPLTTTK